LTRRLTRLQTMYNVLNYRKTWWNNDKIAIYRNRSVTAPEPEIYSIWVCAVLYNGGVVQYTLDTTAVLYSKPQMQWRYCTLNPKYNGGVVQWTTRYNGCVIQWTLHTMNPTFNGMLYTVNPKYNGSVIQGNPRYNGVVLLWTLQTTKYWWINCMCDVCLIWTCLRELRFATCHWPFDFFYKNNYFCEPVSELGLASYQHRKVILRRGPRLSNQRALG